jgi:hypothetical protein
MTNKIVFLASAFVAVKLAACSKVDVAVEACPQLPRDSVATQTTATAPAAKRIVEIDRLLSLPLTGAPEDADRRATLRAERAALADPYALTSTIQTVQTPRRREYPASTNQIVVAGDSRGNHEPSRISPLEAMTPTERERYYRELKLRNHSTITVYSR